MTKLDLVPLWYHQVELVGVVAHGIEHFAGEEKHTYEWVFDFMQRGLYPTDGFITHRFPFEEYRQAIVVANDHKRVPKAIKVVMQT
jgi:threonine dehydrogenase-like Zn-dependent dehydrogenase